MVCPVWQCFPLRAQNDGRLEDAAGVMGGELDCRRRLREESEGRKRMWTGREAETVTRQREDGFGSPVSGMKGERRVLVARRSTHYVLWISEKI